MDRKALLQHFSDYQNGRREVRWKGEVILLNFLRWWFGNQVQNNHEFDGILSHLPEYLVEAMECFRTSEEDRVAHFRTNYLWQTNIKQFPNLTDISAGLDRILIILQIARFMAEITKWDEAEVKIEGYFRAEDHVLNNALQVFNRRVWRTGMWQMIQDCSVSGISGQFGQTEFGTFYTAGSVMMTFSRPPLSKNEQSVSFVANYNDPYGIRTGLQSAYAPLGVCVEMIHEVIDGWPSNAYDQRKVFQANRS